MIDAQFQTLTTFPPRNFQRETILKLLHRQDILLRAPTGSGKTETAIAPFLFAKTLNLDFPNKLIYVVPYEPWPTVCDKEQKSWFNAGHKLKMSLVQSLPYKQEKTQKTPVLKVI